MKSLLITAKQTAAEIGVAEATLSYWRTTGAQRIPYIKVGGRVMYRISDLDIWLSKRTYNHTGEYSIK